MTLPTKSFTAITSSDLATQKESRVFVKRDERTVRVPFDSIVIRKGFNLRTEYGDLEELAASIEASGLQEPITVDILKDGAAVLTDGERRFRAISMLRGRSKELRDRFAYVDARTNDRSYTEADRIVAMFVHNSGKPFEPVEEAEGFRRLRDEQGLSLTQISAKVGKSMPYVEQRLLLATADDEEKALISTGKSSATAHMLLMRQEKDPVKRKEIVKAANAKGKKLKVRDIKTVPLTRKIDEIIGLVKDVDKAAKDGVTRNLLYEIDAQLRELKKELK
jgi:ParB/RepB/Spo0J family partition protein